MDAVRAAPAPDAPDEDRRPVALVLLGYGATVMLPTIGILFALVAVTRPGRWAKNQGLLMVGLATLMIAFGVALLPMVTESYFAGQAATASSAQVTPGEEQESKRRFRAEMSRVENEAAAIRERIRRSRARSAQ
ncbi:MAG TPA: hypothetical protein VMB91_09680 [Solirubrobacteraceae bacterium]|nr:hypothetical protein [Solirubrobacteraceae bacterium]